MMKPINDNKEVLKMDYTVEQMMKDGFTIKMANFYHDLMQKECESGLWSDEYIEWAHKNGFLAESAVAYNLTDENKDRYLSDYDYRKIWPLNSWERIWINDKLTLKYMLSDTKFDKYMPRYYYYINSQKGLIPLVDNEDKRNSIESFLDCLKKNSYFACKPCNGAGSQGFYKFSYCDSKFYINEKIVNVEEIENFIFSHTNYIFTEYLYPSKNMSKISPLIHTLRVVVANEKTDSPFIVGGYLRFANKTTGSANHMTGMQGDKFDIDVEVDWETGRFFNPKAVGLKKVVPLSVHPDNNVPIEGIVDDWNEIVDFVYSFSKMYNLCEYLGFDLCVSTNGIKLMEINSHPGIKHMQIIKPLLMDGITKDYFTGKINRIANINEEELKARHKTWR